MQVYSPGQSVEDRRFDRVYVGTAMIPVLDAIHHNRIGQSVLMIDNQPAMGGAWRSLDAFGLHDVENAIHYLLPERDASRFMQETLGWDIVVTPGKYRVFPLPPFGRIRVHYDSVAGRILSRAVEMREKPGLGRILAKIPAAVSEVLADVREPSYYVSGGSPEMLRKVEAMLAASDVGLCYSTEIQRISFDKLSDDVVIQTNRGTLRAASCVVSHGTKITDLLAHDGQLDIVQQVHPRPAAHMYVRDGSPSVIREAVFTGDAIIKYAHDVTGFTQEGRDLAGKAKVIVFALRNHIEESEPTYEHMFERLKWSGMIGPDATLLDRFWSHIFLPTIDDNDLATIEKAFHGRIDYLRTENFSAGIGYYAPRWAESMSGRQSSENVAPQEMTREEAQ